jgi:hypothetical protein
LNPSPQPRVLPVEIAPRVLAGAAERALPGPVLPRCAIVTFSQNDRGDLVARELDWTEWLPVRNDRLAELGIRLSQQTILRLGYNGYIRLRRPAPQTHEFHLGSLRAHLKRVESDLGFWQRRTIPAGWDAQGEILWREDLASRFANYQTVDLPATCLGADRHFPIGIIRVRPKKQNGGKPAIARQSDLFGEGVKSDR